MKLILALLVTTLASAKTFKDVTMEDAVTVVGKNLTINGMGIRVKTVMGFPIKIYVAGLYLEKMSSDSDEILKSTQIKQLRMRYLRSVDRQKLADGFAISYEANCIVECDKQKEQVTPLLKALPDSHEKADWLLTFYPDKVEFEVLTDTPHKLEFKSEALSKNLLALFINTKAPPTPELRAGLLGL